MTVPILLALSGLLLLGTGMSRGSPVMVLIGAFLIADSMAFYVIFGPGLQFAQTILHR